jgi:hypothetical protein
VFAAVLVEVDQFGGLFDGLESGFLDGGGRPGIGDDGSVVVSIGGVIEQADFRHGCDGSQNLLDDFGAAGFGKVGDAFNDLGHISSVFSVQFSVLGDEGVGFIAFSICRISSYRISIFYSPL